MSEDLSDGCYGLPCRECKLMYPKRSHEDITECERLFNLAFKKMTRDAQCIAGIHDYKMVYPDEDLIAAIRWKQPIEEIWECTRCGKAKTVAGTVGEVVPH